MGANATTFVPAYVSGEVLTAADLSVTNSGIPVFADSTARDAAFGGTGEKTLAEGQFAYIEATNTTQFYDGAAWLALGGKLGQVVSTTKTDTYTMSSQTYATITGLTATITPTSATSKILVIGTLSAVGTAGTNRATSRLIRDSTPIAIGGTAGSRVTGTTQVPIISAATTDIFSLGLTFLDSPSSTSALVYGIQIRINETSGTVYVNRGESDSDNSSQSRVVSTITVMEILA